MKTNTPHTPTTDSPAQYAPLPEAESLAKLLGHTTAKLECMHEAMLKCRKDGLPDCQERTFVDTWLKDAPAIVAIAKEALANFSKGGAK